MCSQIAAGVPALLCLGTAPVGLDDESVSLGAEPVRTQVQILDILAQRAERKHHLEKPNPWPPLDKTTRHGLAADYTAMI